MALRPLDPAERRRHKIRNTTQTWLLVTANLGLLGAAAYVLAGWTGVFWAMVAGTLSLVFAARSSPSVALRLFGAFPLSRYEAPDLMAVTDELARRAGLARAPRLFYVPSPMMNAFAVGRAEDSAIAVTDGLVRGMSLRQLAGVLGHEMSHIRNGDLSMMTLADTTNRLTWTMSAAGLILFLLNLPLSLFSGTTTPWGGALLLMIAPLVSGMIQTGLSRAREYDADLDAAGLTGDPEGLASALATLERRQGAFWELFGRRAERPFLRTHPSTEDRVRRLLSLRELGTLYPRSTDGRGRAEFPRRKPPPWTRTSPW